MTQPNLDEFQVIKDFVKADERGRLVIGDVIKDQPFRVLRNEAGEVRLIPVVAIPVSEVWLYRNPKAMASLMNGLDQAKSGKISRKGPDMKVAAALAEDLEDAD